MSSRKYTKTKYRGVYYRLSETRKLQDGSPDRCYVVWYKDALGKAHWHTVGWHSDGIRAPYANEVRSDLLKEVSQGKNPAAQRTYTVGDAVSAYETLATAEGKDLKRETDRYSLHLRPALAAVPIACVTPQMLTEIKGALLAKMSPASVRLCFAYVRRCINHAISANLWQGSNPLSTSRTSPFRLPKVDNAALRFLTPEEAKALLAELKHRSMQQHDMALLSLKTGLRATEIFSITGQDVHPASGLLYFRAKGGMRQHVHADPDIIDMLTGYGRAPGEHVFQARGGGPISWGTSETFDRAVEKIGLNKGVTDRRYKVIFHTLRHTFASWLAQSGKVTLQELKELMRHERIEMTLRYAHLIPGKQRVKLAIIDDLLN